MSKRPVFRTIFDSQSIVTRNGQSGNTGRLNRNLYGMLTFTERPKTPGKHRGPLQKNMAFPKGINCLQVISVLIWMERTLLWFNLYRNGTRNGLPGTTDTFAESLQLQISVLHQSMSIFKALKSSSYDCWVIYKEKVSVVSDPNQNV